ncbi:helix-hairpin-helix domain-containing protein [Uliginosibacterium aquaticum]|uniref:TfoX/Sxy family DNA transformation protein n=1 Tax=Uliginosibacterium aquaticum TaxID=2731212 RepID=A0ABX2IHX3_9RHOO|nr:helix-hairpin-helix domain-containing protein [Uliginosibacterium aquaticum]NSL56346.1 TfoX/Sxy family DNA transformation protein [Uliginosibacterium aquaticum]
MNPLKVDRTRIARLTDLPNIGKASAEDLRLIGINEASQLAGMCPFELYRRLCEKTGLRHDPCVIDVFMSVTCFMNGEPARPWWAFTAIRKAALAERAPHASPGPAG